MLSPKSLLLSIVIPISFLLLPVTVFAASYAEQLDHSVISPNTTNGLGDAVILGTGLSGPCYGLSVYVTKVNGSAGTDLTLWQSDTPQTGYNGSWSQIEDHLVANTDSDSGIVSAAFSCTLDPTKYYYIGVYQYGSGAAVWGQAVNTSPYTLASGSPFTNRTGLGMIYFIFGDGYVPTPNTHTRIVSFTPEEGTTTGTNVEFNLHAYINPDDIANVLGVQLSFTNIDQNALLSYIPFVSRDFTIFAGQATTSGDFYVSTTTPLPDGNYRVQASIKRTLIGTFVNPFSNINDTQNHQFIVNQGSYIGHLNQNGFNEFNSIFGSTTATSTAASSLNCNPTTFSINLCLAFLFIPGGPQLDQTIQSFQDGIANRWPWGYFYRVYAIMNGAATSSLPSFTTDIVIGPPGNLATTSLTYDPGDMLAGAGAILDSVHDNQHGKSFREVMEPFVLLTVALAVLFTIFADISGSHKHHNTNMPSGKLS